MARSKFNKWDYEVDRNVDELEERFTNKLIRAGCVPKKKKTNKGAINVDQLSLFEI